MQHDGGASALAWIERSALATAMRQELWLYPSVEIIHIWGFVMLVGARHLLPWTLGALLLIVPSGLMMFIAHADDFITNRAFVLKLTLIFAAAINAVFFHLGPYRSVASWNAGVATPSSAKLHAALSLMIWMGVIACGRLLAYL
jgi:hypothetical protein